MGDKERREKIADLAVEQESIEAGIGMATDMMTKVVGDNVTSDTAQIMVMFNPNENVYISASAGVVLPEDKPPDEEPGPTQMIGMSLQLYNPVVMRDTTSMSFSINHRTLIRALTLLKKDLENDQKKLDTKMSKLIK